MKKASITAFSLILFGLKLPYIVWYKSKIKLSNYNYKSHEEMLDEEYIVTSWIDWAIDCWILFTYPIGLLIILVILIATKTIFVLLGLIPIYFAPFFISIVRELGGSLMLLHMNIRGIEKNTHKEDK